MRRLEDPGQACQLGERAHDQIGLPARRGVVNPWAHLGRRGSSPATACSAHILGRIEDRDHADRTGAANIRWHAVADHRGRGGRKPDSLEGDAEKWGLGLADHDRSQAGCRGDRRDGRATARQEIAALDRQTRIDVRRDERRPARGGARGVGDALVAEIEVVADGDDRGGPVVLHVHQLVAGPRDHRFHVWRADHQYAREAISLPDHVADDLERREDMPSHIHPEPVQLLAQLAAGGAGVVGDEGEPPAGPVERRQRLARSRVEGVSVPDAAVEVEDEAADAREDRSGHEPQVSADRANSTLAASYTSRVRAATLAQLKWASTRRRPACPMARRRAGSSSSPRIAAASASGCPGWTSSPVVPSSTTSGMPPTAEATTAVSHAIASRLIRPNGSYTEGQTKTAAWL